VSKQVADLDPSVLDGGACSFFTKPTLFGTSAVMARNIFSSVSLRLMAERLEKKDIDFNAMYGCLRGFLG
jgi:hypothetical protein